MNGNSSKVETNQTDVHERLIEILQKHKNTEYKKSITLYTKASFNSFYEIYEQNKTRPIILDSCCGVGESTVRLAKEYKDFLTIGVDKSKYRLQKSPFYENRSIENLCLFQADIFDFWRLLIEHNIPVEKHFVLYPNPWPKKKQIKRRIHGHPVFYSFLKIGQYTEVRSNWKIYLEELRSALKYAQIQNTSLLKYRPKMCITPFEQKYFNSGHDLYRLEYNQNK